MKAEGFDFEPLNLDGREVFMECCPSCRHFGLAVVERDRGSLVLACPACSTHLDREERRLSGDRRTRFRDVAIDRRRDRREGYV